MHVNLDLLLNKVAVFFFGKHMAFSRRMRYSFTLIYLRSHFHRLVCTYNTILLHLSTMNRKEMSSVVVVSSYNKNISISVNMNRILYFDSLLRSQLYVLLFFVLFFVHAHY